MTALNSYSSLFCILSFILTGKKMIVYALLGEVLNDHLQCRDIKTIRICYLLTG